MLLPPSLADRVRQLIPMLSSSHDGETIGTRNAIGRALFAAGTDWHGLADSINASDRPPADSSPCCSDTPPSFGDLARACRDMDHGGLRDHERVFVHQMCRLGFTGRASQKQTDWLNAIFDRLRRRAA